MIGYAQYDALYDIWREARGDDLLPERSDLRLTRLGALSAAASIFEIVSPNLFRFIFTGENVMTRAGETDLLRENMLDLFQEPAAETLSTALQTAAAIPCATIHVGERLKDGNWEQLLSSINLPLLNATKTGTLFLMLSTPTRGSDFARDSRATLAKVDRIRVYFLDVGGGTPAGQPVFQSEVLKDIH